MSTALEPNTVSLPAPGRYTVDVSHSTVGFEARHLVFAKVRGRFGDFNADIVIGDTPATSSVSASIAVKSIDTGDPARDGHLLSPDFFAVDEHPTIDFRSTAVRPGKGGAYVLDGELTVNGVTKPVALNLEYLGSATDPWGNDKAVFEASTEVDREAFGLTWNQALETGGVLVGKVVKIQLDIEAVRQP